jgi:hypothetical protein
LATREKIVQITGICLVERDSLWVQAYVAHPFSKLETFYFARGMQTVVKISVYLTSRDRNGAFHSLPEPNTGIFGWKRAQHTI